MRSATKPDESVALEPPCNPSTRQVVAFSKMCGSKRSDPGERDCTRTCDLRREESSKKVWGRESGVRSQKPRDLGVRSRILIKHCRLPAARCRLFHKLRGLSLSI